MGRYFWNKKQTVDAAKDISMKKFKAWGYLAEGVTSGTFNWHQCGKSIGSCGVQTEIRGDIGKVRFIYTYSNKITGEKQEMDYWVKLVTTHCNYGGKRWWFTCPLMINGVCCDRRVGVLYLEGKYVGCRKCHNLTYQSCQDSHKFDALARNMGFSDVKSLEKAMRAMW